MTPAAPLYRSLRLATVVGLAHTATLLAQSGRPGQVEVGTFGSFTKFDLSPTNLSSQYGVGGRLGFVLVRALSIEASGDYTATSVAGGADDVTLSRVGATALLNANILGTSAMYVGGGVERHYYRGALNQEEDGAHALIGTRLSLGGRSALRGEIRGEYFPAAPGAASAAINIGGRVGLSIFAFGGPPRDDDADRVANRSDRCPDTPAGARVDPQGCPTDGDRDRVFDGLDACDGTPSGAIVDARGCPTDSDSDGVFDGIDICADTPTGALADGNGCPMDADRDEVFDGLDACPDTPADATVDATGCPMDTDGDRVYDGIDLCPDSPTGVEVDSRGCTVERDSDGDGVLDQTDRCPDTPAGQPVDAFGCPVAREIVPAQAQPALQLEAAPRQLFDVVEGKAQPVVLKGVNFRSGRSDLTPESYPVLDEVALSLVANPTVRIEIGGHTDATGSRQRNTELSLARALAVRAYLASKGVAPDRMVARGYGPDRPIGDNGTPGGRALNRRVELNLLEP